MGKMKENPKYNILSLRVSDMDLAELEKIRNGRSNARLLEEALLALIDLERQKQLDAYFRTQGV